MEKIRQAKDSLMLFSRSPARVWEEAYPLGNGSLGAMVFGGTSECRIFLNQDTLWTGYPRQGEYCGKNEAYVQALALVREGRYTEADEVIRNGFLSYGSEAYLPLGELNIRLSAPAGRVSGYRRVLSLDRAVHTVTYRKGSIRIRQELFVSFPARALIFRLDCSGGRTDADVFLTSVLLSGVFTESGELALKGECPVNSEQNLARTDRSGFYRDDRHGIGFYCAVRPRTDGSVAFCGDRIEIRSATFFELILCAETSFSGFLRDPVTEGKPCVSLCRDALDRALASDYNTLRQAHIADYRELFDRVKLFVGSDNMADIPTKCRTERYATGGSDAALPVLLFHYGRYLTISASRPGSQPMNLQGIWNAALLPPWHSGYTLNINTEMNYFPTLAANLAECYLPLCDMIRELSVTGKECARVLYHAPGWVCHHNTDLWRHAQPAAGWTHCAFWNAAGGWLCHCLYEYYEYLPDDAVLREIYPILAGAAEFYLSQLETLPNGSRAVFPSTSPENRYLQSGSPAAVSETTEMTMAIVRELFANLLRAAEVLGISDPVLSRVREELPKLYAPTVGTDGRLLEWFGERPETEVHHRHVSHLYGLHPGHEVSPETTPELADACRRTLEMRGEEGTGWSLAWKSNFYARLHDGERAFSLIRRQLRLSDAYGISYSQNGGTYPNLLCAHPPFQIDGNFGALSALTEMLLQSTMDTVELLPACPPEWQNIRVTGLCAKGGRVVDFATADGELVSLRIRGTRPARVTFRGHPAAEACLREAFE